MEGSLLVRLSDPARIAMITDLNNVFLGTFNLRVECTRSTGDPLIVRECVSKANLPLRGIVVQPC